MYGRFFRIDSAEDGRMFVHRYLVEHHYADAIADRLASGLFGASVIGRDMMRVGDDR
jgi:hypothetical protein